jgi:hypothetical protein
MITRFSCGNNHEKFPILAAVSTIMWTINAQSVEVVERLLIAGADVNAQDAQGRTASHYDGRFTQHDLLLNEIYMATYTSVFQSR